MRTRDSVRSLLTQDLRAWGLASSIAGSGGNLLLALAVARVASAAEFGDYAVSFAAYSVALTWMRGRWIQAFLIRTEGRRASAKTEQTLMRHVTRQAGVSSLLAFAVLTLTRTPVAMAATFGVSIAVLLPFDGLRYVFTSRRTPGLTAALDATWVVLQALSFVPLVSCGVSAPWLVFAWGASGAATLAIFISRMGLLGRAGDSTALVRPSFAYGVELCTPAAVDLAVFWLVAHTMSSAAAGQFEAATLVFGPLTVLSSGLMLVSLPRALEEHSVRPRRVPREAAEFLVRYGVAAVLYTALATVVPLEILRLAFHASTPTSKTLLVAVGARFASQALLIATTLGFRVRDARSETLLLRLAWAAGTISGVATIGRISAPASAAVAEAAVTLVAGAVGLGMLLHRRVTPQGVRAQS